MTALGSKQNRPGRSVSDMKSRPRTLAIVGFSFVLFAAVSGEAASLSKCDINGDGLTNIADVQGLINEALGVTAAVHDLNADGTVNVVDIQIVVNAALGAGCAVDPPAITDFNP